MPDSSSPLTPQYAYNDASGRYRNVASGKYVSAADVRAATDGVIEFSKQEMRSLADDLAKGRVSLAEWQDGMYEQVKLSHLANAAAANGGWAQMDNASLNRVGDRVATQYDYLDGFAADIESGKQALTGVERRATMYADAARGTYESENQLVHVAQGNDQEKNVLGPSDHCPDCLDAAEQGWVNVGTLIPVGERVCGPNCHCRMEYR